MANRTESSGLSIVSEDRVSMKKFHDDYEDNGPEAICNNKVRSGCAAGHKKKIHPLLLGPGRHDQAKILPLHTASKNNLSEFTQRIMSAKLLRVKQVQNQLLETQIQLNELINENRILKNLQKRQEGALKKYEGNHAELPQLIRSHNEEIRTLKANNKLIRAQLKESNSKLKDRENELESLKENYNKLKKLSTEKNLLEREKLQKKVQELQEVIKQQDVKIQLLSRKVLLESKKYRHHLNIELNKHKETQKDLSNALSTIAKLENQLLMKDKISWATGGFGKLPLKREPKNLVAEISKKSSENQSIIATAENILKEKTTGKNENEVIESSPDTDLELLNSRISSDETPSPTQDIFPDVNVLNKSSPYSSNTIQPRIEMKSSSSNELNEEDMRKTNISYKSKVSSVLKKNSKSSTDIESNAKGIVEKITRNIETTDNMVVRNEISATILTDRLHSLYNEVKSNVSKLEEEMNTKVEEIRKERELKQDNETGSSALVGSLRRSVTKRKLDEVKQKDKFTEQDAQSCDEFSLANQQKLINMSKTWNHIKNKVQEERIKAEQKMQELSMLGRNEENEEFSSLEKFEKKNLEEESYSIINSERKLLQTEEKKDLKFDTFANDDLILCELEKTDKVLRKLKKEKVSDGKSKDLITKSKAEPKKLPENVSFRTDSYNAHKYLEEFQSEYQKQNLLKALKAIDIGKDGQLSEEESEASLNGDANNFGTGDAINKRIPNESNSDAKKDLINKLFGSRAKKVDRDNTVCLEYGIIDGIKAKNN